MKNPTYITRGKKPYQQYFFRCRIPQDLKVFLGYQDEFRVSLKSSLLSQSRIISFDLYQLTQYIFQEMRQGNMRDITIDDVKRILKDKVDKLSNIFTTIIGIQTDTTRKRLRKELLRLKRRNENSKTT